MLRILVFITLLFSFLMARSQFWLDQDFSIDFRENIRVQDSTYLNGSVIKLETMPARDNSQGRIIVVDSSDNMINYRDVSTITSATDLSFSGSSSPVTLNSSTGTDVTITAAGINTLSATSGNITITATEVDGSTTNELQTIANTSDATSHTVTLNSSGGSFKIAEGSNISMSTTGTSADGVVTISSSAPTRYFDMIATGQSNMVNSDNTQGDWTFITTPQVQVYQISAGEFRTADPSINNIVPTGTTPRNNIGWAFAKNYVADHPYDTVRMLVFAVGGTSSSLWKPGGYMLDTIINRLNRINVIAPDFNAELILVCQGEKNETDNTESTWIPDWIIAYDTITNHANVSDTAKLLFTSFANVTNIYNDIQAVADSLSNNLISVGGRRMYAVHYNCNSASYLHDAAIHYNNEYIDFIGQAMYSGWLYTPLGYSFSIWRRSYSASRTFEKTSGTTTYSSYDAMPTINQTGTATGITRGYYANPTLTSAPNWRSFEFSNSTGYGLYGSGAAPSYLAGSLGVGVTSPTAKLGVESTTEQLRLRYDATKYTSFTVNSAAGLKLTPSANTTTAFNLTKADGTTSILNIDATNSYVGITQSTPAAKLHITTDAIGASAPATSSGIYLQNTTAAAAGVQQYSPSLTLEGQGWKTDATAATQTVYAKQYVIPVQSTATAYADWVLATKNPLTSEIIGLRYTPTGNIGLTVTGILTATTQVVAGTSVSAAFNSGFILTAGQLNIDRSDGVSVRYVSAGIPHRFAGSVSSAITSGEGGMIWGQGSFAPTSGTGTYNNIKSYPTINQTGGANGITRGFYSNPTLTAAADWRSFEWSNTTGYGIYGASAPSYFAGKIGIGVTSATAYLHLLAGTATANTAPLKFTVGTALTAAEAGVVNFVGNTTNSTFTFTNHINSTATVNTIAGTITKTDTGDPANAYEGQFCINTFDNTFKVYAEGAWRTLTTW